MNLCFRELNNYEKEFMFYLSNYGIRLTVKNNNNKPKIGFTPFTIESYFKDIYKHDSYSYKKCLPMKLPEENHINCNRIYSAVKHWNLFLIHRLQLNLYINIQNNINIILNTLKNRYFNNNIKKIIKVIVKENLTTIKNSTFSTKSLKKYLLLQKVPIEFYRENKLKIINLVLDPDLIDCVENEIKKENKKKIIIRQKKFWSKSKIIRKNKSRINRLKIK